MSVLALDSVSKQFSDAVALDAVSIDFPEGLLTAIIGPSGCGKSTLLQLCNGLLRPDSGTVELFGAPLNYDQLSAVRRRLGYAVQGNALFPHLSAMDNITLLARLQGWSGQEIEQRVDTLLQLSHLEREQIRKYPHQLSGGQQQRVGLCRALMLEPDVLLLDEPFAAIDPITRADIHQQLLELQAAEPRTALLVTHDMREALRLADHILVMTHGKVVHSDSKDRLLRRHGSSDPEGLLHGLLAGDAQ